MPGSARTILARRLPCLRGDDLERPGGAGAERLLHLGVADARGVVRGHDLDRRHARLQPEDRQREQKEYEGGGGAEEVWVAPEPLAPAGEAGGSVFPGMNPAKRERVHLRPKLREHRRQQRQSGREHEDDADHDPERHRAEGRAWNEHHRRERDQDGGAREQDGLPGRVHRHRDRVARLELRAEEGAAEPVDDEERVVDAEREREHQREVHRPDRDLEPVREQREQPGRATRPRIVSINGSPAATSVPNASTRMIIVTGQEKSSDFIIAVRLAVLKSLHIPEAPVSETLTPSFVRAHAACPSACRRPRPSRSGHPAPAVTIAVCRSAEIDAPGRGATTEATS